MGPGSAVHREEHCTASGTRGPHQKSADSLSRSRKIRLFYARAADKIGIVELRAAGPWDRTHSARKRLPMKLVVAIIKPFKLDEVRQALTAIGVHGMTVTEVKGYGRQKGHTEIYRGAEYVVNFLPKLRIEIAVSSDLADRAVQVITSSARTGQIGDGKIFVTPIDHARRIRTGETDSDAL
jgi:nitrogen regulatory protein P-II 2